MAVVGDGMDSSHEDLAANVNSSLNHDYSGNSNVFNPSSSHGTQVAGIIAGVGDNQLGVRGVAPQASIYSYNLAGNFSDANAKDAMTRNHIVTAVSNNNWGPEDIPLLHGVSAMWEEGVETGIREGFGGKGVFYVWAAGDGYDRFRYLHDLFDTVPPYGSQSQNAAHEYDQANFDEYSNYYPVTTVCSVDGDGTKSSFSEEGVNLWVCAPGFNITTTYNKDRYAFIVSGTSYSAAQVSGVAALMREVNSDLSWRDLKLILAASARKNDPTDSGWETVALKYGSDTDSYNYNPKYGFGVVDTEAAAGLAESWNRVGGAMATQAIASTDRDIAIPDRTGGADGTVTSNLTIPDNDEFSFVEFVEVELVFSHTFLPDLNIQVTSPAGTVSQLVRRFVEESSVLSESTDDVERVLSRGDFSYTDQTHRFGSAKHLGEDPAGKWILKIDDTEELDTGTLHSWSIKVYGHRKGNTIPDFSSDTIDDQEYVAGKTTNLPVTLPVAAGGNAPLTYSITPALPTGLDFDSNTRVISGTPTAAASKNTYTYTVTDDDGDTDDLTFGITIAANEVPSFSDTIDDQEYIAGTATNLPVTLPEAAGGNAPLTYSITPALPTGLDFDSNTRVISGTPAAAASRTAYTYTVTDEDGDTDDLTFGITISADVEPGFSDTIADQEYVAGTATNLPVTLPEAAGGNAPLTYSITPALPTGLDFTPATRAISGTPTTAASKNTYTYTVEDIDGDTTDLTFGITIAADVEPGFSDTIADQEYVAGTATNLPVTLPVAAGGNAPLTYSITPALPTGLDFDSNTRVISGTPTAAASKNTYTYTVEDIDGDTTDLTFGITVAANEEPGFSDTIDDQEYVAGTATNLPVTLPEAAGGNAPLTYSITPALPTGLDFDSNTRVISGTPAAAASRTVYTYTVTDEDGDTDDLTFGITISADVEPGFSDTIGDQEYVAGKTINLPVTLPAATGGNAPLTYSITPALPTGLDFDSNTRVISGTPAAAASRTAYTYTVTDEDGDTDDLTFGITVAANEEPGFSDTIADQEYIAGTGTNLPVTLPAATGGNAPLTYSITPGLPAGLDFTPATRVISGTPTTAASRTAYTYTVTDEDGDTDDLTFGITVAANEEPSFSDTIADQEYIAGTGTNLPVTLPVAAGGNAPLTYSITPALPTGLDFDINTRVISGTPATAASRTAYTYTVTDDDGDTADLTFGITISADVEPGFSDTIADQEYVAGKMTNLPVTLPAATGGNAPLTYSITPRLPAGLDFNASAREISGTPTTAASRTVYTYTVTDEDGDTTDLTFGITVAANEEPGFSDTIDDQEYITGTAVTETLPEAAGGNGVLRYSITPGLPTGLNFDNNTRVISGTPVTAASRTVYTYTVTDEDGDMAELTFGITVGSDVPTFGSATVTNRNYVVGTAVTVTLPEAAGGNGTLRYSLTPALPTGLDFNASTRVISGTPTSVSSSDTYTYTVTDEDGDMAELSFTIRVVNRPAPPRPGPTPDTEAGGGGGCAISDQNDVVSGLFGVIACLMLIPVSVLIRRKRRSYINL